MAKKCNSRLRHRPGRCKLPAGWGTEHLGYGACSFHFGRTTNAMKAAQKEMARDEVSRLGLPRDISPHEALLEAVRVRAGVYEYLRKKVSTLEEDDLAWGVVREESGSDGDGDGGGWSKTVREARQNIWYKMLSEAERDLVTAASSALKAGVEERHVQVAERHARAFAEAMRGFAAALADRYGFDADDEVIPQMMRRQLLLASGADPET